MRAASALVFITALALPLHAQGDRIQRRLDAIHPHDHVQLPSYAVVETNANGTPRVIVAAFDDESDVENSAVVAFRIEQNGRLTRLASLPVHDVIHRIEAQDATGDGRPEALVTGTFGNRSAVVYVVEWDGRALKQIVETSDHATFEDVDGDGRYEIVESWSAPANDCEDNPVGVAVQRFGPDGFTNVGHPLAVLVVTREDHTSRTIAVPDGTSPHGRLHIVNGTKDGRHRASSLKLTINDEAVPLRLTAAEFVVDTDVTFPDDCNEIELIPTGNDARVVIRIDRLETKTK